MRIYRKSRPARRNLHDVDDYQAHGGTELADSDADLAHANQLTPQNALMMNRLYGNQHVGRLIQQKKHSKPIQRWGGEDEVCADPMLSDPYAGVDNELLTFTENFNRVFKDVLYVFRDGRSIPKKNEAAAIGPLYQPTPSLNITNGDIDPFTLEYLFTDGQRQKNRLFYARRAGRYSR